MARNVLLLLVVLASACTVAELDLTTKSCPCPSGWDCGPTNKCVRAGSMVDAGVDASCSLDRDDDAVDDCRDNCPAIANAQQYDEDGDARGDACDLCPGDADDGANSDGDGVGDACDPSATTAERIALFEGFHAGIPAGWTVTGNWAHVGDDVVLTSGVDVIGNLAIVDPAPNGRSWLVGKLTVGTLHDPGSSTRYVSLLRKWDQAADSNVRCLLYQATIGGATSLGLRDTGPVPGLSNLVPHPFATGQTERFVFEQNGTAYRCTNGALVVTGMTGQTSANAKLGLRTRSVSASYAWMMIIVPDGD